LTLNDSGCFFSFLASFHWARVKKSNSDMGGQKEQDSGYSQLLMTVTDWISSLLWNRVEFLYFQRSHISVFVIHEGPVGTRGSFPRG
jgi:hypothetical protein